MNKLIRIVDKVTTYFFPEVESAKEICISDWCWITAYPLISVSILLYVLTNAL